SSGACGGYNSDSEFVIALNSPQFGSGGNCYKMITIHANGKSTQAQIVDECVGCGYGGIDMSPSLFQFFGPLSLGVLDITWSF
ncbi:RlpA-like double-psi beta-barrel-protein domain-containing protein-containing protein, partial [Hysterangium stoloniferum]